jgi:aspartate racemase
LTLTFEYSTDLFEAATIERMAANLQTLLEGIVVNPEQRIAELPLLTKQERTQLLVEWNQTESDYPNDICIHELFEEQAERTRNSIAVVSESGQLSYVELNRRANQLAHYLQKRGVGPNERVGLCIERSNEMLVGMLGILKAGGAYLPLDPAYPHDRLSFMLEDAGAKVLLTQEHLQEKLPAHHAEPIFIDRDWKAITREMDDSPDRVSTVENLAYVMYTSGSTGRPKAVGITHRSVVRLVKETNYADFGPDEVFLQFAPLSFDASTFEIWGSLLNGGRLVVMPPGLESLTKLGEAIKRHGVTTLWLTAGLFQQMVETELESLRGVRQLLAGGETLPVPHVEQVAQELKGCQLINGYGPTENTTFTCCYPVKAGEQFAGGVPVGFPVSNTQVYILDHRMEPVPIGVVGQLYIGGAGLAVGYLNDPALTAQRFVPDLLSRKPGARLYSTGDLARYRADGSIEFLGRMDHQVKLRGHRIELGEIESALKSYPAVRDAVVTLQEATHGNKHLVGYVVNGASPSEVHNRSMTRELKGVLKNSLPDYMVPAYFVFLENLPRTPSGKIDRGALPHADGTRPDLEEAHIPPRDDLERRLANIWERLLGVQPIGIRDDFFHLGGHSLLAVRLVSEIQKETGQRLPLISFFQGPNIEYLASLLRQDVRSLSWPTLVEIQAGGPNPPLFCVSMPNVNALGYRSLARYLGKNQAVFGLQAQYPEDLEGEHSREAVDQIVTHYLGELRAVRPTGPYQFVGLCRGAHIAYEMARRLEREGHEIALLGVIDTWVMENTYNYFWLLQYHTSRVISSMLRGIKKQLSLINKKSQSAVTNGNSSTSVPANSAERKQQTVKVYFPGPDFVPTSFEGRIAVFRTQRQPRTRIRDPHLGWGKLARGGVDLHFIPGGHESVLKEPYVQGLAAALKKCLRRQSHQDVGESSVQGWILGLAFVMFGNLMFQVLLDRV